MIPAHGYEAITPPEPTWADIAAQVARTNHKLDDTLIALYRHQLDHTDDLAEQARKDTA